MRSWIIDQYEFDKVGSEENLEISYAIRNKSPFPNAQKFAEATINANASNVLTESVAFQEYFGYGLVRDYLGRFAGLNIPKPCTWPTHIISDDIGELDIILCGPNFFIRYYWYTTA